jgi:putative two-component system response regulator
MDSSNGLIYMNQREVNGQSKKILIADDQLFNIRVLEDLCKDLGHDTAKARNGREVVELARSERPDCILMDVIMPEMDGLEATRQLKNDKDTAHIPVIIITALDSRKDRLAGIAIGADDFLTKPIDKEELALRLRNNLRNKEFQDFLAEHKQLLEMQVAERTKWLREGYVDTIHRLVLASEFKDKHTGAHINRIGHYARELAEACNLGSAFAESIFYASPMHDVGKVAIPDSIQQKPGTLTASEWQIMKTHTTIGAKILEGSHSPYLQMAVDIAKHHHERWDGTGYPNGLKGEEIPLTARIMNICDQYDALRSERPYKQAFTHEKSCKIILEGSDRTSPEHFDPELLEIFRKCLGRFAEIYETLRG